MSANVTPNEHIALLLSCIKHSANGKIDFVAVARDCKIVSSGAAAKRFSRLQKAHEAGILNVNGNGNADENTKSEAAAPSEAGTTDQEQATEAKGKAKRNCPTAKKGKGGAKAAADDS
ncbi:hypothetical protein BJX63DRAFT_432917 [Aspergillus granulosus]|uniref:Myb-like DNA-binding domain-containing protein n=1 Tax=Aspergillus granulosus TaxID=176169 RepID=A0ABR4H9H0_9EURO